MKNNKGVSLISLVVAVIILILLASVTISSNREAHSVIRLQSFLSKMKIIQAKVDEIAENENYSLPNELKMDNTNEYYSSFQNIINKLKEDDNKTSWIKSPTEVSDENITNYYCFTPEDLEEKLGIKNVDMTVIINFKTRNVIAKDGITIDGKTYYRQYDVGSGETVLANEYLGKAVMMARIDEEAFWKSTYIQKITNIDFQKQAIDVPEGAIESWNVKANEDCADIMAYIEDDGTGNGTYKLTIVSPYTIYANPHSWGYFDSFINLNSINFDNFDTSNVIYMDCMFSGCSGLTSIDVSNFDTSNVIYMGCMFSGCSGLTSIDVSNFDTSKVKYMDYVFDGCSGLTSLDVSNFDTSEVIEMGGLFSDCSGLTSLNVSNFDTSEVTGMEGMFINCSSLASLNVSNFDTSNVTNMDWMFAGCSELTSLDLSSFDTSKVTEMLFMFRDCSDLTSLNVSGFDTSHVTDMTGIFENCTSLTNLDLSSFDTSKVTDMSIMFSGCSNLDPIWVGANWTTENATTTDMFNGCKVSNVTPKTT